MVEDLKDVNIRAFPEQISLIRAVTYSDIVNKAQTVFIKATKKMNAVNW